MFRSLWTRHRWTTASGKNSKRALLNASLPSSTAKRRCLHLNPRLTSRRSKPRQTSVFSLFPRSKSNICFRPSASIPNATTPQLIDKLVTDRAPQPRYARTARARRVKHGSVYLTRAYSGPHCRQDRSLILARITRRRDTSKATLPRSSPSAFRRLTRGRRTSSCNPSFHTRPGLDPARYASSPFGRRFAPHSSYTSNAIASAINHRTRPRIKKSIYLPCLAVTPLSQLFKQPKLSH